MQANSGNNLAARRRGAVAVMFAVMVVVLLGFAALSVDVGHLYLAKAELQRTADAAALSGALSLADDRQIIYDQGEQDEDSLQEMADAVAALAVNIAAQNSANNLAPVLQDGDVVVGLFDFANPTAPLAVGGGVNAVQVTARLTQASANGPVAHFFAPVLGAMHSDVTASAVAAFDDHFVGYAPPSSGPGPLIPFTIYVDEYEDQLVNGPDQFEYDDDLALVREFPDSVREIRLFPYKDDEGGDGAGNFGILNIGIGNMGVPGVQGQILYGVTAEQLAQEIGTSEVRFFDDDGNPITHDVTGNPGMQVGMEDAVETRVGDVVGFFVHSQLVDTGSNSVYTITNIRFGRLMEVHLTGKPDERRIRIQPAVYTDPGIITDPDAPSSQGQVGKVLIVQ